MEKIIVNSHVEDNSDSKILQPNVNCGQYFEHFLDSRKRSEAKPKGLSEVGIRNLREETTHILSHCNPHDAVTNKETTHLVVGYVQSGKTMSFTALTALALDNNYRVIIYLAGTKNNLLDQTRDRLRKDLTDGGTKFCNKYKIHSNPTIKDLEDISGHLESSDKPILLMPILKNYKYINELAELFNKSEIKGAMAGETVMIVDDEADQASLNSYGRKNSKKDSDEEEEKSSTYDAILRLRSRLHGNTYIQYTATPQANILISMHDLLSPKSHTLLTPGEGYVGGKLFFGKGPNGDLFNGRLVKEIPPKEVFHKKQNRLREMPQSLVDALMYHILAVAITVVWAKEPKVSFLSMMVHPDETKAWNLVFKNWIDGKLSSWRKLLAKPDGQDDKEYLLKRFEKLYPSALEFYDAEERPEFKYIRPCIADVLYDKQTYLVNTDKDAQTDIQWSDHKMHILVGAEMLNRGFTIENLATTYMPRYSTGLTNADTIQQRCRFFGYKMDYIRSCRVFLPSVSIENYHAYIDHEEELRKLLGSCDSLSEVEHRVLLSPRLRPTRANVLPVWVVNTKLKGMTALQAFTSKETIESNTRTVEAFLEKHKNDYDIHFEYTTTDRTHRGFKLGVDEAIKFLSDFCFNNWSDAKRKAATIRYLRFLSSSELEYPLKYVYFIQMAYNAPSRRRLYNASKFRLSESTGLFAGPTSAKNSTYYPGDTKIVGDDSITIQLHHVHLKGAPIEFGEAVNAYTLAINYPGSLASSYYESVKGQDEDEEDDDE